MTPAALATELAAAYTDEAALYRHALDLAESFARTLDRGEPGAPDLARLAEVLAQVQCIENRLVPIKAAWQQTGSQPAGALATALAQVADLIRVLQTRLDQACRRSQRRQQELAPALDDLIRRQNMRRAYGQA